MPLIAKKKLNYTFVKYRLGILSNHALLFYHKRKKFRSLSLKRQNLTIESRAFLMFFLYFFPHAFR